MLHSEVMSLIFFPHLLPTLDWVQAENRGTLWVRSAPLPFVGHWSGRCLCRKPRPSPQDVPVGLQMLRLALILNKDCREEMTNWNKGGGQEEGAGFSQLGP